MFHQSLIGAIALAALCIGGFGASAQEASKYDPSKYPDWSGPMRWTATGGGNRYDQTKPAGRGQRAPLTAEYQAIFEAGLKDQAEGGQGANQTYSCLPGGYGWKPGAVRRPSGSPDPTVLGVGAFARLTWKAQNFRRSLEHSGDGYVEVTVR